MQIPDTSLLLLGNSSPLAHTPFPCARGMTAWLKVIRNEPRRNERLENSAFQGQGLAVHFFLDHQPHHIILSKRPVSTASRQKGRRQAFSPSLLHTGESYLLSAGRVHAASLQQLLPHGERWMLTPLCLGLEQLLPSSPACWGPQAARCHCACAWRDKEQSQS